MGLESLLTGELLPAFRLVEQQLGEAEVAPHAGFLFLQAVDDLLESFTIGPAHRPAAIDRPAIAVDPNHIDVGGPLGHAFLEDFRALIDHGVERALDDFVIIDLAAGYALLRREILNDLLDDRRRRGTALVVIIVEAGALLLSPAV